MTAESANSDATTTASHDRHARSRRRFPRNLAPTRLPKRHLHRIPTVRRKARDGRRQRREEGLAEFVLCLPVFFLLVIGGIQFALWSHATHLARAAAEQGSQIASDYGSSQTAGSQAAYQFIATTGSGTLTNPQVATITLPGGTAQVTVTGRTQAIIPWFDLTVSATSDSTIQEYRTSG